MPCQLFRKFEPSPLVDGAAVFGEGAAASAGDVALGVEAVELTADLARLVDVAGGARAFEGDLEHALKFQVFEARLFENSRRSSREPRELLVAELTGDGLLDVALLVHDRLIVYPQEPAP